MNNHGRLFLYPKQESSWSDDPSIRRFFGHRRIQQRNERNGGDHMTYLFIGMLLGMIVGLAIGSLAAIVKYTDYEIKRLKKELAEKETS